MKCRYACHSPDHQIARRTFLQGAAVGLGALAGGLRLFRGPVLAQELAARQKRVLAFFLNGGLSQLESWDPKPGTETGGPCLAIPTSVPGLNICELLPHTATQMHRLAVVRGMNTKEDDHGLGQYMMRTGRRRTGREDPELGAVVAKALTPTDFPLPGHIKISPGGSGGRRNDSAYLGPKYASIALGNGNPPPHMLRPDSISADADRRRNEMRLTLDRRFASRRRTASTDAYTNSYEQAAQLMLQRDVFDVGQESEQDQQRYGTHDLGRHCLLARRLLERGVTYVEVEHANYDTHSENFHFHIQQLGEFDRPFATLIGDLADRGLLDHTLVLVMSEFGRTPEINQFYGRDHWSAAWSVVLGGCRVHPGAVLGKTNENGTEVIERPVDHGELFHTCLAALGLDSKATFNVDGRVVPMADPAKSPVKELFT